MTVTVRPTPLYPPPEGFHFEAVEDADRWQTPAAGPGRCRFGAGPGKPACGAPAVATLQRPNGPWNYCAEHLYGRWIEDGKIMRWHAVRDEEEA